MFRFDAVLQRVIWDFELIFVADCGLNSAETALQHAVLQFMTLPGELAEWPSPSDARYGILKKGSITEAPSGTEELRDVYA